MRREAAAALSDALLALGCSVAQQQLSLVSSDADGWVAGGGEGSDEGAASCARPAACSALASCSTSFARESLSVTRLATPDQGEAQAQGG